MDWLDLNKLIPISVQYVLMAIFWCIGISFIALFAINVLTIIGDVTGLRS